MSKRFGLLGKTLDHSFSPEIHRMLADYEYQLYPVGEEQLAAFLKETDLDGFNVTIPYKQTVLRACDEVSETAQHIGSVNTVIKRNGRLYGYNTDFYGFFHLLGSDHHYKKALVLGSGGASKAVQAVLADCNIPFVVISRTGENNYTNLSLHRDADLIVNATPVGMYPENGEAPINLEDFPNCRRVLDLIYNPLKTALILQAEALGIKAENGLKMLVSQAANAAQLFEHNIYYVNRIEEVTDCLLRQQRNIALIGMPGCGKTTVGETLASISGREFYDCDRELEKKLGMSIPEYFETFGEAAFRKEETKLLLSLSQKTGIILSCGGGVVCREQNLHALRQNSVIVHIERSLESLPSAGRPVTQARGLIAIAAERMPKYEAWADVSFVNDEPNACAKQIQEAML